MMHALVTGLDDFASTETGIFSLTLLAAQTLRRVSRLGSSFEDLD